MITRHRIAADGRLQYISLPFEARSAIVANQSAGNLYIFDGLGIGLFGIQSSSQAVANVAGRNFQSVIVGASGGYADLQFTDQIITPSGLLLTASLTASQITAYTGPWAYSDSLTSAVTITLENTLPNNGSSPANGPNQWFDIVQSWSNVGTWKRQSSGVNQTTNAGGDYYVVIDQGKQKDVTVSLHPFICANISPPAAQYGIGIIANGSNNGAQTFARAYLFAASGQVGYGLVFDYFIGGARTVVSTAAYSLSAATICNQGGTLKIQVNSTNVIYTWTDIGTPANNLTSTIAVPSGLITASNTLMGLYANNVINQATNAVAQNFVTTNP